jgi:hypothetical protein
MTWRSLAAVVAVCGAAATAAAQTQTATYSFVFTSPGAVGSGTNNIVPLPGSVVNVAVHVSFNPGIGSTASGPGTLTGTVLGLSAGSFSITGNPPGTGFAGGTLAAPYNFIGTNPGTSAGTSHNGVIWGMGFLLGSVHPSPENPDVVWNGTFSFSGVPALVNLSFTGLGSTTVWAQGAAAFPFEATYTSVGLPGTIGVPTPAGLTLLACAGLAAFGRRRRRP